jgi:cytochrome c peroxidase
MTAARNEAGGNRRVNTVRRSVFVGPIVLASACLTGSTAQSSGPAEGYPVAVPLGLDIAAPVPGDNPLTKPRVELGRVLFFDPVLSADSSLSCASCHQPSRYFADDRERAVGIDGREGTRNVPSVLNVAYGRSFFWDGRAVSLEEQILAPLGGDNELGLDLSEIGYRLRGRGGYTEAFRKAFGSDAITSDRVARAIASYLRTLRSGDAPVDRYLYGDATALSADARRGFRLFVGRANCGVCHTIPLFTDHQFHNTGISRGSADTGRFSVTGDESERGAFKTPSLRNVAETAPYMHDGSIATLEEVIEHYDRGGTANPHLDDEITALKLSPAEKRELIAFLESLTGRSPAR